jgi:DNA-binding transcriptional LysR family regulator
MSLDSDLAFFVLLARKESFSGAALAMSVSTPAVSKRLAKLENRLGVRLLNRTTRRVSLTSEGEVYLHAAERILRDIQDLEQGVTKATETPQGLLRINATFGFGREHVASVVSEFATRYPAVEVQLILSDAPMNLVEEGIDLGIRFGTPPNNRLVARRLLANRRFLCATPAYLERCGTPRKLSDLSNHNCIILRQDFDTYDVWKLQHGQETASIKVRGSLSSNDGEVAMKWVLDDHGIMLRSEWDISRHVRTGRLGLVLPKYSQIDADIYAIYPARHNLSARIHVFVDFLSKRLSAGSGAPGN